MAANNQPNAEERDLDVVGAILRRQALEQLEAVVRETLEPICEELGDDDSFCENVIFPLQDALKVIDYVSNGIHLVDLTDWILQQD